jgi:hypothetical protein
MIPPQLLSKAEALALPRNAEHQLGARGILETLAKMRRIGL